MVSHVRLILVCLGIASTVAFSDGWNYERMSKVSWKSKREATATYYVNLLLYIDYEIFNRFYTRTTGSTEANRAAKTETEIKKYYTLYAQSMNSIYSGINSSRLQIQISLVDILIPKERETWISLRPDGNLATGTILNNFHSKIQDYNYGHAMLITGHKIIGSGNEMFAGRAILNSICQTNKKSVSVVVDQGRYQSVRTACHELAHSLGVEHDSGEPGCLNNDQYIMAGNTTNVNKTNKLNRWRFSRCSVKAMEDFIGLILSLSPEEQRCLTEKQTSNINQSSVENLQPGQVYTPDQQCQMILGPNSYYLRDETQGANICTSMKCGIGNQVSNIEYTAAEGTSCGSKKWCQLGRCVSADEAPNKTENCVFGDRPVQFKRSIQTRRSDGSAEVQNLTCPETAQLLPRLCYLPEIVSECCSSCGQIAKSIAGCEYGDRILSCLSSSCDEVYHDGYVPASACCRTCNLQTPFVCQDQDAIECSSGGAANCYDYKFAYRCCKTCERARDLTRKNCEYGDRDEQCGDLTKNGTENCDVSYYKQQCCQSCKQDVTSSGHRPILALSSCFLLVMSVVFHLSHAHF